MILEIKYFSWYPLLPLIILLAAVLFFSIGKMLWKQHRENKFVKNQQQPNVETPRYHSLTRRKYDANETELIKKAAVEACLTFNCKLEILINIIQAETPEELDVATTAMSEEFKKQQPPPPPSKNQDPVYLDMKNLFPRLDENIFEKWENPLKLLYKKENIKNNHFCCNKCGRKIGADWESQLSSGDMKITVSGQGSRILLGVNGDYSHPALVSDDPQVLQIRWGVNLTYRLCLDCHNNFVTHIGNFLK